MSEENSLMEDRICNKEIECEKIPNPLVASQQINTNDIDIISKEYYNIYILTLKENISEIDESIYYYYIDKHLYNKISENFLLLKAPNSLLKNYNHYSKILILSKQVIESFNSNNYQLQDKNLVLLMLNINCQNIKLYLSQYEKVNTLIDIYKILTINKYFNIDTKNYSSLEILKKNILNVNESNYWTHYYNCSPNLSLCFEKRKLNYQYLKNINKEFENYLKDALKKSNYIDPSRILLTSEYKYKISNNNVFSREEINDLLNGLPAREKFLLFCNLIISKSYSHLALNNKELLIIMKPIIKKYIQLFRYLIGYAWIRFYFEESIKKSYTTKDDQFIFNIDTAAELPLFPFAMNNPKMNPYCPILVNDNILNSEYNIGGIFDYKDSSIQKYRNSKHKTFGNNGITNLNEFKNNFNIFLTGNKNKNILENIDWTKLNIAIGGSIMCACIQKHNPLIDLFSYLPEEERLKRYFNEYYANADVDVMFLGEDVLDFMDRVKEFYNQIVINICNSNSYAEPSHIKLVCNKFVYLFVSENDIKNVIEKHTHLTYDKVIHNFEDSEIKNLFLDLLNEQLEKYKKDFFSKLSEEQVEKYKIQYSDYINFDNLEFKIRPSKKKNTNEDNEDDDDEKFETGIGITYKYKLHSPHLDVPFELFMIKYSFMSIVQNFHLPCVRSYYDGLNVYLTPSCISAHLTYMNLDYKYFAGTNNPIEIINKYRMRGFGTWLNEEEKIILLKYSSESSNWNCMYNINITDQKTLVSNLGPLKLDHKIYRPRLHNPDAFINSQPVSIQYFNITSLTSTSLETTNDYINELSERYQISHEPSTSLHKIFQNLQTINELGSINPIEKWIIESSWNISQIKNDKSEKKQNQPLKYKHIK
jgi:hypothetical protein